MSDNKETEESGLSCWYSWQKDTDEIDDEDCVGNIKRYKMFGGQINLPMCERHLKAHKMKMTFAQNGGSVDELKEMGVEQLENKLHELNLLDKIADVEL